MSLNVIILFNHRNGKKQPVPWLCLVCACMQIDLCRPSYVGLKICAFAAINKVKFFFPLFRKKNKQKNPTSIPKQHYKSDVQQMQMLI